MPDLVLEGWLNGKQHVGVRNFFKLARTKFQISFHLKNKYIKRLEAVMPRKPAMMKTWIFNTYQFHTYFLACRHTYFTETLHAYHKNHSQILHYHGQLKSSIAWGGAAVKIAGATMYHVTDPSHSPLEPFWVAMTMHSAVARLL